MTPLDSPVSPSPLPSPPTSPISPTTATATRTRIKASRRTGSSSEAHGERTRSMSPSFKLSSIVAADPDTPGSENRSIALPSAGMVAGQRRQSSITYYTPTSPSPWSQRPQFNNGPRDGEHVMVNGNENVSQRSSLVLTPRSPSARESVCSADGVGTREREPLTLVEKHADLLHFIAQKERKCLELRDQLAAHEKELAELKRKWERIVSRGHDVLPNSAPTASLGGVALDGLKEGVRMLAAGFSDFGGVIQELDSGDKDISKPKPLTHARNHNNPSNARAKQTGSRHLSTSSMSSSIYESVHASDGDGETMMVVTAPSLSRAGSLNYRMHKRASRTLPPEEPPTPTNAFIPPPAHDPKLTSSLDVRMSLILTPSPTLVPSPLLSTTASTTSPMTASTHTHTHTHTPVPTTTPRPMSSWMDNMGKKLSGLQKGPTFSTKSQKRASSFLTGVSNTITAALTPGPTPTTPAPLPSAAATAPRILSSTVTVPLTSTTSSSSLGTRPQRYPTYQTMADWLDDNGDGDGEDDGDQTVHVVRAPILGSKRQSQVLDEAVSSFDDDNDWNW